MTVKDNIDCWLKETIRKAIDQGKLFELVFTPKGRRLWANYPEKRVKEMVKSQLKGGKHGSNKQRARAMA